MNPYKFDEPVHIAFSGGRSSAYMLRKILDAGMPEGSQVVFCNTGKEMEQTLEFVRDCSINWGIPIVWLEYVPYDGDSPDDVQFKIVNFETASRNGEPFEALIKKCNYLPNAVVRKCTYMLKIRTAAKYCKSVGLDIGENDSIVGFRYDEMRRVNKLKDKLNAPMATAKVTKLDVSKFWGEQNFDLNLPNFNGVTKHGNCDLCFLKGGKQVYSLIAEDPSRAIWWAKMEALALALASKPDGAKFHKDRPTYQQMLDNVSDQKDWIGYEEESVSCFCGD